MRILILLFVFVFVPILISCGNLNNNQTKVYETMDGEFIVSIETLNIDLKPYVNPEKVSLTHTVKHLEI